MFIIFIFGTNTKIFNIVLFYSFSFHAFPSNGLCFMASILLCLSCITVLPLELFPDIDLCVLGFSSNVCLV